MTASAHGEQPASLARNALHLIFGQAASVTLGVVTSALLARSLGAIDFGLFYLVGSVSAFAYVLADWGTNTYLLREIARSRARAGELLGTTWAVRALAAIGVTAGAYLVTRLLGYDQRTQRAVLLMMGATLPLALGQLVGYVFRAHERMDYEATGAGMAGFFSAAVLIPVVLLGGGLFQALLAQGAANLLAFGGYCLLLRRLRVPRIRVSVKAGRELVHGGAALLSLNLVIWAHPYIDATLLSKLSTPEAVGWFAAGGRFVGTLLAPATILGAALFPRLSRLALGDMDAFRRVFREGLRPLLALGALALGGTWLYADIAVAVVFGTDKYGPSVAVLRSYAPCLFLIFLNMLLGSSLIALGKQGWVAAGKLASIVVAAGLDAVLIPWFTARNGNGGLGVTVATVASETAMLAASISVLPRGILRGALLLDGLRAVTAAAGMILLGTLLGDVPAFVRVPAGLLAFAVLAWAVGLVHKQDLAILRDALRKKKMGTPPPTMAAQTNVGEGVPL